jgi:hypothetical protein
MFWARKRKSIFYFLSTMIVTSSSLVGRKLDTKSSGDVSVVPGKVSSKFFLPSGVLSIDGALVDVLEKNSD